ncbi:6-phosphogluconolactonase [Nesidiocoris tenuis]|uniref:6-phosphogluconolactonase n=1 Tax=Nesidiocoris tenuis TaxID=355587 RepID=A0ABN7B2B6_9HEMI|nr:6-phosphogluconolactonase [Nesidiocoris tenuis]
MSHSLSKLPHHEVHFDRIMVAEDVQIVASDQEVIQALGALLQVISNDAIAARGKFTVGVSGGSLISFLTKCLPKLNTDFTKWVLAFCDERVVPFDDCESTYGTYRKAFCDSGLLKPDQFIAIDPNLNVHDAAKDYAERLAKVFPSADLPSFDVLLLGMGPDGHTCSLFPDHPGLKIDDVWVAAVENSPKPPPNRVTLTYPVINNSANCIFALSGAGKADVVKRILDDGEKLPSRLVQPTNGKLVWILDEAAASKLKPRSS